MDEEGKGIVALARCSAFLVSSLDYFQLADSRPCERVFPFVPDAEQLFGVLRVDFIDINRIGVLVLFDEDRVADDDVDRSAVGHEANVVVEDTCGHC